MTVESLEPRQLLSGSNPTAKEQFLLELINRARANPAAEAARLGIALNEGLAAGTISTAAKQPLAFNRFLVNAARGHSQDMIDHDYFGHTGFDGTQPQDRMANSGYFFDPNKSRGSGENIAETHASPNSPDPTQATSDLHDALFIDSGIAGRGHRTNLMNPTFKEVGTGVVSGVYTQNGNDFNAVMLSEDFAYVLPSAFLTGVAYSDSVVQDNFYTVGEALGGVTITATRVSDSAVFNTTTFGSGGYTLALDAGTYTVVASGAGLASSIEYDNVVIGSDNVKRDFIPGGVGPADTTPPTGKLHAPAVSKAGGKSYTFTIDFKDPSNVLASTVGAGDVQVSGPHKFKVVAKFVSKTTSSDARTITATYKFTPPGGRWDATDNGKYTVSALASQVSDVPGNFMAAGKIGLFTITLPAAAALPGLASALAAASPATTLSGIGLHVGIFTDASLILDPAGATSVLN